MGMIVVGGRRYREEDASRLGLLGPGGVKPIENDKPEGKTPDADPGDEGDTPDAGPGDEGKTSDEAGTGEEPKRPAKGASKDEWVTYALANGKTEEELEGLTKDQIIELYPAE